MSDNLFTYPINTPEALGVIPRYVLQHNAISRSIHNLSATAKKLTAMALLPPDLSSLTASFTVIDFCKALGYGDGGKEYQLFVSAVDECMKCVITVETGKDKKGRSNWEKYTWFTHSKYNKDTGVCTMTFSKELAAFIAELKRLYAKINLKDLGMLQSKYAIRIFELAKSYESLSGRDGNQEDAWYFERTIIELRLMLGVPDEAYKEKRLLRQKVIEEPVKEINRAGIGLEIESEGIKQGRNLIGIRLKCKKAPRKAPMKRGRPRKKEVKQMELSYSNTSESRMEKETEHLRERYPDEFAVLYQDALNGMKSMPGNIGESLRQSAAEYSALEALRKRHGIVK